MRTTSVTCSQGCARALGHRPVPGASSLVPLLSLLVSSSAAETIVWDVDGGPYQVSGTMVVGRNDVLRVLPGAEVHLDAGAFIVVDGGELDVRGAPGDSVHFRSLDEDLPWGAIRIGRPSARHTRMCPSRP